MIDEKTMMKDNMVAKLALFLIEDEEASTMPEAFSAVINSETYLLLLKDNTGLYYQSPRYVYDFLINEIREGKAK